MSTHGRPLPSPRQAGTRAYALAPLAGLALLSIDCLGKLASVGVAAVASKKSCLDSAASVLATDTGAGCGKRGQDEQLVVSPSPCCARPQSATAIVKILGSTYRPRLRPTL